MLKFCKNYHLKAILQNKIKLHEELNSGLQSKDTYKAYKHCLLGVTCFTEEGLRLYHQLGASNILHLDATGTIVLLKKTNYDKCTMLYYVLVMVAS